MDLSYEVLKSVLESEKNTLIFQKQFLKKNDLSEVNFKRALYQIVGDLILANEENEEDETKKEKMKKILENIKERKLCWDHPIFSKIKGKIEEHDQYLTNPFEVEEGVAECKKCGSKRAFSYQKQTRGSDEPMTTFYRCSKCDSTWIYSG